MGMVAMVAWLVLLGQPARSGRETRTGTERREKHMAAVTKGQENLQEAIDACQQASTALAEASVADATQAKTALQEVLTSFNEVRDKFFLKTMMSVPPTKVCRTEAVAVAAAITAQNWQELPAALDKLQKATKALVTKAKMDGTTIT